MAVEVLLSQFGMGMQDGKILRWYVAEGQAVTQGQPICEVEAAKSVVDIEAPASGILARIIVQAEETAQVRDLVAIIDDGAHDVPSAGGGAATPRVLGEPPQVAPSIGMAKTDRRNSSIQVEPRARRRAAELGVDVTLLTGTGPGGRITTADVEQSATRLTRADDFEDVPVTAVRRTIARRLTEASQTIPHFYVKALCRAERLMALRRRLNVDNAGTKITVNDLILKAAALALRRVPEANVSWRETAIRHHHRVDVAFAVATPDGLFTPIVRDADRKPLAELAAESAALADAAREGSLQSTQYEGGSLTVSNLGMYDVVEFAAIINPPQAAILAIGAIRTQPVIVDGLVVPGMVFAATLSVDHRAVDGATAGRFIQAFQQIVETAELDT